MNDVKRGHYFFRNFGRVFKYLFLTFSILFSTINLSYAERVEDLNINKYVNDYANIIDDNVEASLEQELYNNYASTSNQIVIVTVNNIDGDYIEHYSIKLAEKIKAGTEKNDNGVILLVAKDDRVMRIEVGYGLEPYLTDGVSNFIRDNFLIPNFKSGDYTTGIQQAAAEIIKATNNSNYSVQTEGGTNIHISNFPLGFVFFIIFFVFVTLAQWIISIMGRTKSWWLGGLVGLISSLPVAFFIFIIFNIAAASVLIIILTAIGLLLDYAVSKNYKLHLENEAKSKNKGRPAPWWVGGAMGPTGNYGGNTWGSNSWGSSSRSSGGFSGGGGSFGGGGSSGSW